MNQPIAITAFYKFFPIGKENVSTVQDAIDAIGKQLDMFGLTLVAAEGINGTVSGSAEAIESFKKSIQEIAGEITFKDSSAAEQPFKRWFVKVRDEIVGIGDPNLHPDSDDVNHLSPSEWKKVVEQEDVVLLDTRNTYETEVGMFKGAIDPELSQFDEFPEYVERCNIPKDKKVLMYCTGGIRCEKALLEMKRQGYNNVYQLKGGILQYLKEYPDTHYEGECFVFDHRACVDQKLQPSTRFRLCPHCGDCGDQTVDCPMCESSAVICHKCQKNDDRNTCSKNCAERFRRKKQKLSRAK